MILCKHCRFYKSFLASPLCTLKSEGEVSVIDGEFKYTKKVFCEDERKNGKDKCGNIAKFFMSKVEVASSNDFKSAVNDKLDDVYMMHEIIKRLEAVESVVMEIKKVELSEGRVWSLSKGWHIP